MTLFSLFAGSSRRVVPLAAGIVMLAAALDAAAKDVTVDVPGTLNPDKRSILRVVSATGVQVYACAHNPAGAIGWVLRGPEAQLFDAQDKPAGRHYAGPTWEALDGGKVIGEIKASMPAPVDKAIPWLLVNIKSRDGTGAFTPAQAIVRMQTTGGTAPGEGCDETRSGQEVRVPYEATYVFLK